MTPVATFAGRRVALFGLGGSGVSTLRALMAGGAEVAAWDDSEAARAKAAAAGFALVDLAAADWSRFAALRARARRAADASQAALDGRARARRPASRSIGDIELFCRERARARARRAVRRDHRHQRQIDDDGADRAYPARGGTRRRARRQYRHADPRPAAAARDARIHVVECSSFQIDLAPSLAPSVGLLINVTPDHLDRHGTIEAYAAIKERLVANADIALVGVDDEPCRAIAARLKAARAQRSSAISRAAVAARRRLCRRIIASMTRESARAADRPCASRRRLRGAHNGQNAAFAFAAARALGLGVEEIARGLRLVSRPRASHGAGRTRGPRAVRQRFQGDQRGRRREGAAVVPRHLLDSRRQAEGGRHRAAAPAVSAASPRPI